MNGDAWLAIVGSILIGLVVRLSNVIVTWLSRFLGVEPPEPIPTPQEAAQRAAAPPPTDT